MIDEIPIIGVTEWTVDGLAAKEFAEGLGHRAPSGRSTGEQGGEGEEWGTGSLNSATGTLIDGAVSPLF